MQEEKPKILPLPLLLFIYTAEGLQKAEKDILKLTMSIKYPTFHRIASIGLVYT